MMICCHQTDPTKSGSKFLGGSGCFVVVAIRDGLIDRCSFTQFILTPFVKRLLVLASPYHLAKPLILTHSRRELLRGLFELMALMATGKLVDGD